MGRLFHWLRRQREASFLMTAPALSDLGFCKHDFADLLAAPADSKSRMEKMAGIYGLDRSAITAERWRELDMARTCANCPCTGRCRRWLRQTQHEVDEAGFCPNAGRFRELAGLPLAPDQKPTEDPGGIRHHYI